MVLSEHSQGGNMTYDIPPPKKLPEPGYYYHFKHDPDGPLNNYAYYIYGVDRSAPRRRMRVIRASERSTFIDPASGARRDSFGPALAGSKVEFLSYVVPRHTVAGPFPAHASGTIEHVHLAAGSVRVRLGTDAVTLEGRRHLHMSRRRAAWLRQQRRRQR
jgi:hypothetical protein